MTTAKPRSANDANPPTINQGANTDGGNGGVSGTSQPATMSPYLRDHYLEINKELMPLGFYDIPCHPTFDGNIANHPPIDQFVQNVFRNAQAWDPTKWKKNGTNTKIKVGDNNMTKIKQYVTMKNDRWFARYNVFEKDFHDQYWEELDHVLRQNHSEHEQNYTPDVFDRTMMLRWDENWVKAERLSGMKDISMEIIQMFHKINGVRNRYFTLLVLTGTRNDRVFDDKNPLNMARQFIVVQLPVNLSSFPDSVKELSKATSGHVYDPLRLVSPVQQARSRSDLNDVQRDMEGNKLVQGYYASVEQVSYMDVSPDSVQTPLAGPKPHISWCMSTASNAGGHIPRSFYGFSVPGKIAKDVKYVTDYIKDNRGTTGWPTVAEIGR